jgi:hypothetical protein
MTVPLSSTMFSPHFRERRAGLEQFPEIATEKIVEFFEVFFAAQRNVEANFGAVDH